MDSDPYPHTRFAHGPERRTESAPPHTERRQGERRRPGIGWIPLFRDADPAAVADALHDTEVLRLPVGTALLRLGQTNDKVYVLLSGAMTAHLDANLNPLSALPIAPGQCLGELSAIDGKPVSATVLAVLEARVLVLSREVFWNRVMGVPGVAVNLMGTITERMRRTNEVALSAQREQLELIHLRKELDVARQLQASMLPLQRPIFPDRHDIEVCGLMEPASNVGGDLFDAFFIDDRRLFFCIGDVSGHGIAAALFMARTIGLLRVLAMNTLDPQELLENLNDRLCVGNDTDLFVTLFCGVLDVASGDLRYSNGGHCAPVISSSGKSALLDIPKGPVIGVFPGMHYATLERQLNPGDVLFCYTDGVTEANNAAGDEYTEGRLVPFVRQAVVATLPDLLERVRRQVADFTATEVLEDDCTMLAVRRPGQ